MAKIKPVNGTGKVPNKVMHSRVSFLFQAATYMATQHSDASRNNEPGKTQVTAKATVSPTEPSKAVSIPLSRRLASELRSVALKAQLRISPHMKHTICKNCDTVLIDGSTCTNEVENKSKGGKKPWADILARKCNTCGMVKRYPLSASRQKRRGLRGETGAIPNETVPNT